jgi:glycerophosphoryl diester phosphodiesterase
LKRIEVRQLEPDEARARMRELAALGVAGIFTDRPALLREVLDGP